MKNQKYKYLVHIYWDAHDQIYVAEVPELPGCATHGKTIKTAAQNAEDAIATWIDGATEIGKLIPEPLATKDYSGKFNLRIDPLLHKKLTLKARRQKTSLNACIESILSAGIASV